nr:putative quinol monooxygenase [Sphingobium lignivorans]
MAGSIRLPPERLDEARPVLARMVEASRTEPGCVAYSFAEDLLEPGLIRIFELFEDRAAQQAHSTSPHMAAFRAAWEALGIGDRAITEYEVATARER